MGIGSTDFKCIYSATTYNPQSGSAVVVKESQVKPLDFIRTSAITNKRTVYEVGDYYEAVITIYNAGTAEIDQWMQTLKNKTVDYYPRSGGTWHFNAIITKVIPFCVKNIYEIDAITFTVLSTDLVTFPTLTPPPV